VDDGNGCSDVASLHFHNQCIMLLLTIAATKKMIAVL